MRRLRGAKTKGKPILNKEPLTHNILYAVESISQVGCFLKPVTLIKRVIVIPKAITMTIRTQSEGLFDKM
jgi:hypothetical protein